MLTLIISCITLLTFPASILAIPFIKLQHRLISTSFMIIIAPFIVISITLYISLNNCKSLLHWQRYGQYNYEFAVQLQKLDGLDGMIAKVQQQLNEHPEDRQASIILKKLINLKKTSTQA